MNFIHSACSSFWIFCLAEKAMGLPSSFSNLCTDTLPTDEWHSPEPRSGREIATTLNFVLYNWSRRCLFLHHSVWLENSYLPFSGVSIGCLQSRGQLLSSLTRQREEYCIIKYSSGSFHKNTLRVHSSQRVLLCSKEVFNIKIKHISVCEDIFTGNR